MRIPAPKRRPEPEETLDLGDRKVTITHTFGLDEKRPVTGTSRWRHNRVLSEEDPSERISTHLFDTPQGRIVARVSITDRNPARVLAESRACLLDAQSRNARIERPIGLLAGKTNRGNNCVVYVNEYIPGKNLQELSFRFWNRKKRVELAAKAIGRIYENHYRNVLHNHTHLRNILLTPKGEIELIDNTRTSFISEDPGEGEDPYGLRASQPTFKLMDLSTFTRNTLHPEPVYKTGRKPILKPAPLLRNEDELREALELSRYKLPGMSMDEILENLRIHHKNRY